MSRAAIEQSLTGLLPTLNGPLPPELVELALSLLTRSRSVASSMKSDEEIARPYACAQLACERSKKRLNLPAITSRPPCPPRIYKKLYAYLSSALPAPTTATPQDPQTPRKSGSSALASSRNTPKTPMSEKRTPRNLSTRVDIAEEIPAWVMPTIRTLVKAFNYIAAAPHVFTGVESILTLLARMSLAATETPSKRSRRAPVAVKFSSAHITDSRVLGLIAVIFLYVYTRMRDVDVLPEQYEEWHSKVLRTLLTSPTGQQIALKQLSTEVEQLMPMAAEEGWLNMEWFLNITPPSDEDAMDGIEMTSESTISGKASSKRSKAGGSDYIGLGTMMQDATDYLGERKQEDYAQWKAKIMARVSEIEAS